ncbi:hypothetical protein [Streptomyces sp. NPDC001020]
MSQSTTATTELTSQYAAQVISDLERNAKEQDRVSAEIAALQERLAALRHDHSVLVNVQQALGASPVPAPDGATVPAPRKEAVAETGTGKRTRVKKAATAQGRSAARKPAGKKPVGKKPAAKVAAAKNTKPTLVELVRDHLIEQGEPRSAAEVATVLGTAHPERGIKTTVVRNTLEGLVAKNKAQRTKQGAAVFYAASDAAGRTAASAKGESQSGQGE